jgi:hypothetical protein
VTISSDGNTVVVGGPNDSGGTGAVFVWTRAAAAWSEKAKLVGSGTIGRANEAESVAISAGAGTIPSGGWLDNNVGPVSVFGPAPAGTTSPGGVTPPSGNNTSASFQFTFSDPRGWQDLDVVNVLINNFLHGRNACYLAYSRPAGVLYLVANDGSTFSQELVLDNGGSISNGQCSITGAGSSPSGTGNTLTLTLNMTFTGAFTGNKIVYMAARDLEGGNSGWRALGVRQVPVVSTFPSAVSVSLAFGSGSTASLTFSFSDTKGTSDLGVLNVLINNFLDWRSACYIAYSQPFKVLYLVGDAGGGLSPVV